MEKKFWILAEIDGEDGKVFTSWFFGDEVDALSKVSEKCRSLAQWFEGISGTTSTCCTDTPESLGIVAGYVVGKAFFTDRHWTLYAFPTDSLESLDEKPGTDPDPEEEWLFLRTETDDEGIFRLTKAAAFAKTPERMMILMQREQKSLEALLLSAKGNRKLTESSSETLPIYAGASYRCTSVVSGLREVLSAVSFRQIWFSEKEFSDSLADEAFRHPEKILGSFCKISRERSLTGLLNLKLAQNGFTCQDIEKLEIYEYAPSGDRKKTTTLSWNLKNWRKAMDIYNSNFVYMSPLNPVVKAFCRQGRETVAVMVLS